MSFIPLFFYVRWALGATATWTNGGGDGLWSTCANWSGGTGTGGCPGTNDIATFNSTSTANAAIDTSISVAGINIASSYTGTITQNSTFTVTIGASGYTQAGGTFTGGDSVITLNNTSGSFSLTGGIFNNTSATMSIVKNMTVNGGTFNNSGIVQFNQNTGAATQTLTCSGTISGTVDIAQASFNQTFTLSSGCIITLASSVTTKGSITNNGTINATNITMNDSTGSTSQNFTQNGTLNMTGTLSFSPTGNSINNTLTCTGTFPGTVDYANTSFSGSFTLSSGCTINLAANVTTKGSMTNNGTMNATNITMNDSTGSTSQNFTQNGTLNLSGTLSFAPTSNNINNTLTCTGTFPGTVDYANTSFSGSFTLSSGCTINLAANVTTKGSMTNNGTMNATNITLNDSTGGTNQNFTQSGTLNLSGTLIFNTGGVSGISSTLTCSGGPISGSLTVNNTQSASTFKLGSDCTVTGNFTRTNGVVSNPASPYTLTVQGDFSMSASSAFGGNNLTLSFGGSGNQTITQNAGTINNNIQVNKNSGTATLSTNLTSNGTATVSAGTFFINGKVFTAGQGFTVQSGGNLQMIGSETPTTPTLNTGSTVTFVGNGDSLANSYTAPNWSYSNFTVNMTDSNDTLNSPAATTTIPGNFTHSGGIFSAPTTLNVAGNFTHSNGTFTNNSGTVVMNGSNQKIFGNTTFYNLTKSVTGRDTLFFEAGKTQTITNICTLNGVNGGYLSLFSTVPGTQWKFDPQTTRTFSYLAVKDSDNVNVTSITTASLNINNLGDNTNWDFGGRPISTIHVSGTKLSPGVRIQSQ